LRNPDMIRHTAAALCLAALGLTACDDASAMRANAKICADFKAAKAAPAGGLVTAAADAAAPVDECVRRWAYSLAPSKDGADEVGDAVVAACSGALSRWNQQGLAQGGGDGGEALSLTTGQPTNPLAEHRAFAQGRALFYVVQARAGHCAPPPTTNGVPDGLPA
jgi:hypothetical protein